MMSLPAAAAPEKPAALASRADITAYLAELSKRTGAEFYLLLAVLHDRDQSAARIIASNWVYDAIQLFGFRQLAGLAASRLTAAPGQPCRSFLPAEAPDLGDASNGETAKLLQILGHAEVFSLKLHVGRQQYFLLLSAGETGRIDAGAVASAHLPACYALSRAPELLASAALADPLTERERECMYWVSEGKTTDDVAVILGVSANTVNGYVASAIQKLGSSNRAMAMATAIRSGVI